MFLSHVLALLFVPFQNFESQNISTLRVILVPQVGVVILRVIFHLCWDFSISGFTLLRRLRLLLRFRLSLAFSLSLLCRRTCSSLNKLEIIFSVK